MDRSRRTVLKSALALTASAFVVPGAAEAVPARAEGFPQPEVRRSQEGLLETGLTIGFTRQSVPQLGEINTRTYEGGIPGPTLRVRPGDTLLLHQDNRLPPNPDQSHDAGHNVPHGFNTFNLHTHGLHVSPTGDADNVFRRFTPYDPANGLEEHVYTSRIEIPDDHEGGTYWYHPHVHGATAVQVLSGMAGVLIVDGAVDEVPEIAAAQDVVVCISELKLNADGEVPDLRSDNDLRVASTFLVNGQVNPTVRLRPGEVQRWRLLNAGAFTVLPVELAGHALRQIAQDGVTFTAPVAKSSVQLAMGNRADVLVQAGSAPGSYPLIAQVDGVGAVTLMTMEVEGEPVPAMGLPEQLPGPAPVIVDEELTGERRELTFHTDGNAFPGQAFPNALRIIGTGATPPQDPANPPDDPRYGIFDPDVVNHRVRLGTAEEWVLRNDSTAHSNHPFHLHTNHFLVTEINGVPIDPPVWHDTIGIDRHGSVVVRVRFEDFTGTTVLHCHHLQHEDEGMMQVIQYE